MIEAHTLFFIVTYVGVSMNPTFIQGDTLNVCGSIAPDCSYQDVQMGDVIVFYSATGVNSSPHGGLIVHRVIDIWHDYQGHAVMLVTQGDNRHTNKHCLEEIDYVMPTEYRGKVTAVGELTLTL